MLRLVTGRIGCGKTTRIYSEIRKRIEQGGEVILIVPEQYSFHTEKKMLELLGAQGADRVNVVSFSFLAKNLLKKYGLSSKKELDDSTRAMLMSVALCETGDRLQVYSRHRYSPAVILQMLKTLKDFRQCSITPERLEETSHKLKPSLLKDKLDEILLIDRVYTALVEQNFFDDECALDILCHVLDEHRDFEGANVFVDGFRGFTSQEYAVLEKIMKQSNEVWITVCTDKTADEFGVFAHTQRTKRKLIRRAQACGVDIAAPVHLTRADNIDPELDTLEKGLYAGGAEAYEGKTEEIILCSAEDFDNECEFVACTIKRLLRTENIRCRDIAVISRSESNYSRRIRSALAKNGVPVFEDKRQPITSEPLIEFVRSAVEIGTVGFTTDALMRLAKTGLTDLNTEEIASLENYALLWQINGSKWLSEWTAHPNGLGEKMLEQHITELNRINEIRVRLVAPLQKFRKKMKEFTSLEAAQAIYALLTEMNVAENLKALAVRLSERSQPELAAEQDRIWSLLMEMLDKIADSLSGIALTPSRFRELFDLLISTYSVGNLPQGLDEITIGSADRVKTSAPKVVFAVGMNDGVFPMIPTSNGIFSENERRELAEFDLKTDDSFEEKMMEERFIAYNTLCSASDRLYVTYLRKDINGAQVSPSEIVIQIKKIFPNLMTIDTADTDDLDRIESREGAFDVMAELTQEKGTLYSTLREYFETAEGYSDRLSALDRSISKSEFKISDGKIATELFGRDMYMSASRTEVYHKCPFEYFCKYGLNAQPRKTAELDPMQRGTAIHYILEKLISAYGSDGLCAMEKAERDKLVTDILKEYYNENLTSGEEMGERFSYLFEQLALTVCEVVDRLVAEFRNSSFVPVAFELKIDKDGEVDTYELPLPDGGTLKLKGSVDRVDVAEQEGTSYVRVVDYKSGGKKFNLNEVFHGLNMQMLIYLFAIWKNGFRDYKNITPAGILYMPVNAPIVDAERGEDENSIASKKLKDSKMNGMVLDDSRVIYMMDNSGIGLFLPASIKKDHTTSGTIISIKQMGLLMKKCEKILVQMATDLHNGVIHVMPTHSAASKSPYSDVCKFCDYREVCHVDENTPTREIEKVEHAESLINLGGDGDA